MTNLNYIRLANNRLAIEGYCVTCSSKLLKTKVMPRSGIKKKKLMTVTKKKKKNKDLEKARLQLVNFELGQYIFYVLFIFKLSIKKLQCKLVCPVIFVLCIVGQIIV